LWRRWETDREYVQPLVQLRDGTKDDQPCTDADFDSELVHWNRGQVPFLGELRDLVWLTQEEALQQPPEIFGVDYSFDNDDRIMWTFPTDPP